MSIKEPLFAWKGPGDPSLEWQCGLSGQGFPTEELGPVEQRFSPEIVQCFFTKQFISDSLLPWEHLSSAPSFSLQFKAKELPWSMEKLKVSSPLGPDMQRQTRENEESNLLAPPKPGKIKPSGPSLFQAPVNPARCNLSFYSRI